MGKRFLVISLALLVFLGATGRLATAEDPAERAAVKHAIEQSIGWAVEKDFEAMFRLWADDLFHFWLFSDSVVVGLEAMKKHAEQWRDPDFRGTRFEFRDLRIVFSRSGDVAWYSCYLDDCYSFKGKDSCLKNVFQTGVLEKRDGRWVHALMHGSYPVDKIPENYVRHFYRGLFENRLAELPKLTGPYLGQTPPGLQSRLFAPGFVSTPAGELNSVFSPDGREFFFSRRGIPGKPSVIMSTRQVDGAWTVPQPLPFCGAHDDIDLFLLADGQSLVFCSSRPREGRKEDLRNHDFWVSRRSGSGWGEPEPFASKAASETEDYFPVVTRSGTLYFNSQRGGPGTNDIYASKRAGGEYQPAEKLPAPVNTRFREFDAWVAPDEKVIIFSSERPGGRGGADIYASFRYGQGNWSEPVNLGPEVNSGSSEYGASLSPDGRYLFFTSNRAGSEDIYWISAEIVERLRPAKPDGA